MSGVVRSVNSNITERYRTSRPADWRNRRERLVVQGISTYPVLPNATTSRHQIERGRGKGTKRSTERPSVELGMACSEGRSPAVQTPLQSASLSPWESAPTGAVELAGICPSVRVAVEARSGVLDGLTTAQNAGEDGGRWHGRGSEGHGYLVCGVQRCPGGPPCEVNIVPGVPTLVDMEMGTEPRPGRVALPVRTRGSGHTHHPYMEGLMEHTTTSMMAAHTRGTGYLHSSAPSHVLSGGLTQAQKQQHSADVLGSRSGVHTHGCSQARLPRSLARARALRSGVARFNSCEVPLDPTFGRCATPSDHVTHSTQRRATLPATRARGRSM